MKGGQIPMMGGRRKKGYSKKGGQVVTLGGSRKYIKKGGSSQCGMNGGSFAEVSGSAGGQLTSGNGMGVSGAGEIATGAKLGPIGAQATLMGNVDIGKESLVVTQKGGRHHKRGSTKHKRRTAKRGSTKHKRRTAKRGSTKRKSRKY